MNKKKMIEANQKEKNMLIDILEKRAKILLDSIKLQNQIVTTIPLKNRYKALLAFIKEIKKYVSPNGTICPSEDTIEGVNKIIALDRDCLIEFVLELSWLLLNPDHVYNDIKTYWKDKIENLDNISLQEIVSIVKSSGIESPAIPMNYFTNISTLTDENGSKENKAIEANKANMKRRIEILLNIMVLQKYYDRVDTNSEEKEEEEKEEEEKEEEDEEKEIYNPPFGGPSSSTIKGSTIQGGGQRSMSVFNKPLINVMNPIFKYFEVLYDPIYSFIDHSIVSHTQHMDSHTIENIIIPSLLMIHHICNNITKNGTYRIVNINKDVITFINHIITNTEADNKHFQLPKVYLSTLLNKSNVHTYPNTLDYIQLFTVGNNLNVNSKHRVTSFFNNKHLYIIKSKEEIPLDLYEIDFNRVDMYSPTIKNKKLNNKYLNTKTPEKISDVVSLSNNFNNAQLTLSIFIAFKELMSK